MIAEIRYNASNPEYEVEDPARFLRERRGRFLLGRYLLDIDELIASYPRRSLDAQGFFDPLPDDA